MRDIAKIVLLLWIAVCTTLAAHFRARLVEELKPGGDYTEVAKKYHKRFVMTIVVGLMVFAVSFVILSAPS